MTLRFVLPPSPMSRSRARIRLTLAGGAFGLLLLGGCAVGPNYSGPPKPETPVPTQFKNSQNSSEGLGSWKVGELRDKEGKGAWWEVFGDPELNRLEASASANNQDLRISLSRIEQSRAQTRVAAADFYPNADFDGRYTRQRTSNTEPVQRGQLVGASPFAGGSTGGAGGTGGTSGSSSSSPTILTNQPLTRSYNLFRVPVDLNWEVDIFGRVRRNYEAARAAREASEADQRNVALMVSANVATTYFNLHAIDAEEDVLLRTIKSRGDALGIAEERLQAGLSSEVDVQRERAELAGNQSDLAGVQRTRAEMENALATLAGRSASSFRQHRRPLTATPPHIPVGLPSGLLERRPDIAEAERTLAESNARIGVAVAAFFPVVRLTGAAGFESANAGMVFDWPSRFWQLGPSVSLPIFEGGRNIANLRLERARYDEGVARYRQQVLVAFQDVENALVDLRTLSVQAAAQGRAVSAARRTLELSQNSYGKGATTLIDVVDAERTLLVDERTSTQILGQRLQASVQLIKALGGGWEGRETDEGRRMKDEGRKQKMEAVRPGPAPSPSPDPRRNRGISSRNTEQ